jgi:hypothetical protein
MIGPMRRIAWRAVLALVLARAASACLPMPPGGVVVVELRPPDPRWETMGHAPAVGYVWVGGFWAWRNGEFLWMEGRWMPLPPGQRYWVPGRWVRTRRGWYFIDGYWD